MPSLEWHDQYQVRVEGSRKLTLRNRRYLRKYTRYQPPPFAVIPMEVEPSQNDRDDDPVRAQVVQEPVVGDIPDAEVVQPDGVAVGQPADQMEINVPEPAGAQVQPEAGPVRRSTRATKGLTSRYKDFVLRRRSQRLTQTWTGWWGR